MSLFGVEVGGVDAVRWGLALEALPDGQVDDRARTLAARLVDPELVRHATRSWRAYDESASTSPRLLVRAEQAAQMWSFRRR
jgi:enoyl-CoA hydratase/carnithine racemase